MEKSAREIEKEDRIKAAEEHYHGEGRYIFENKTAGDIQLEKAPFNGNRWVKKGSQFQGDSFFLKFVPTLLKLIEIVQEPPKKNINESTESKLILDQPDTITQSGKVEHVESQEDTQLNDSTENKEEHEGSCACDTCSDQMLLTEDPMDGVDIILD
jgi:hypothetical protein